MQIRARTAAGDELIHGLRVARHRRTVIPGSSGQAKCYHWRDEYGDDVSHYPVDARMIVRTHGLFTQSIRPPRIYLDHWAVRYFSQDEASRKRILSLFETRGTLLFSPTNALEIGANSGSSLTRIRTFLGDIGEKWVQLAASPMKVIEAENERQDWRHEPYLSRELSSYYPDAPDGVLSLGTAVGDMLSDLKEIQRCRDETKGDIFKAFAAFRQRYAQDASVAKRLIGEMKSSATWRPMSFVLNALLLLLCRERSVEANDATDFFHATFAIAYCDVALLDQKWTDMARRVRDLGDRYHVKIPRPGLSRVHSKSRIASFFRDLEQF